MLEDIHHQKVMMVVWQVHRHRQVQLGLNGLVQVVVVLDQ
jgi:hypothetical protein